MAFGMFFVLLTGSAAHFLYEWSGKNGVVGLFTPINESVWEHMKLLFFPMLLYAVPVILHCRGNYPSVVSSFCSGILFGTLLIPVLFYAYTSVLGRNILFLDIGIFILSIAAAFRIACRLTLSGRLEPYTPLLLIGVCTLFVCFIVFTYCPPDLKLFEDPAQSHFS